MLLLALAPILAAQADATVITIDATRQTPISKYIYGVNHPNWKELDRGFTLARQGGNRMTAYNWETNASNAGNDWQHQNDGYLGESNEPGWTVKAFLQAAQQNGAAAIITVPTAGYVAADKKGDGDVNKTPNFLQTRFQKSLAKKPSKLTFPPNTNDKFVYQDEFVAWVERTKSPRTPVWYSLDNEPDLWGSTHQRIWPKNPTYAQIIANNIQFSGAIKSVAPKTMIFGPANYGWQGFRTFQNAPDARGRDFLDVYLSAMRDAEKRAGMRLIDALDIHWYPEAQGGGVRIAFGEDKPGTAEARIQAPRSLWDPTYVEESWISNSLGKRPITLLPRVSAQIRQHYPGTKLALTEYNYGGGNHISGALAQADVLGLFGRYGVFAACNWGLHAADRYAVAGFKSFIDYDGKGSRFGDRGLAVSGQNPAEDSAYAALDSINRNRMTIVAINKTTKQKNMQFALKGFRARQLRAFTLADDAEAKPNETQIWMRAGRVSFFSAPLSVTTIELIR